MGEATYYLKAQNCDQEKLEKIRQFFYEGVRAEEFWQNNRDMEQDGKRITFWAMFATHFPMVTEYLATINLIGRDCNNDPAGFLDFGTSEDVAENFQLLKSGELHYNAYVWHFADWRPLLKFLETEFSIKDAKYVSDEHFTPFDSF